MNKTKLFKENILPEKELCLLVQGISVFLEHLLSLSNHSGHIRSLQPTCSRNSNLLNWYDEM